MSISHVPHPTSHDPVIFGRVAVLMGGWSAERQVSLWSGEGVAAALREKGVDVLALDVTSPEQLFGLRAQGVTRAFNILHGTGGEDGTVQAILDVQGIAYPGSGVLASALAMDKLFTKRIWKAEGLPTADFRVVTSIAEVEAAAAAFGYPFILKPAADGSSVGVSKVKRPEDLAQAFALALGSEEAPEANASVPHPTSHAQRVVMAEAFVAGGEYTCPVLRGAALPIIRIEPDGEFYDFHAKYISNNTRYHCPSGLPAALEASIQAKCLQAFALLGCKDWGRVDFLMGDDGVPMLLEVNTLPGMTSHSLVPMAAKASGLSYADLCLRLLEATLPEEGKA